MLKTIGGMAINLASSAFNHNLADRSAQKQYDRQLEFWRLQNEYNNPSAQRARMERAGFNPALIAGEVAGNNVAGELSNVPGNQVAQNGTINLDSLNQSLQVFGQLEKLGADTDMMRRQIELSFIDEIIKNGQAYGIKLDNEQKQVLLKYLATEKDVSLAEAMARIEELNTRSDKNVSDTAKSKAETSSIEIKLPYEVGQLEQGIKESVARTDKLIAEESYTKALEITENELRQSKKEYQDAATYELKAKASLDYAMARVNNINADLQAKYGDRALLADTLTKESAARYADDLNDSLVQLRKTASELNRDNVRHNEATELLQKEANEIRSQFNKLYGVGLISEGLFKMLDKSCGSLEDILNLIN